MTSGQQVLPKPAVVAVAFAAVVLSHAVWPASQWYIQPEAEVETLYDDNVRLTPEFAEESFAALVRARAAAGRRTETSDVFLAAEVDSRWYADVADFDRTNGAFVFKGVQEAERSRFGLDANFDYDSTRTSEEETTGLVQVDKRRSRFRVRPYWRYALTPRADVNASASYEQVSYEDVDEIPLFDYSFVRGAMGLTYRMTERLDVFSSLSYEDYEASDLDRSADSYGIIGGAEYALSPTLTVRAAAGARYSETEVSVAGVVEEDDTTGPLFELRVEKEFDLGRLVFSADRRLRPTGRGDLLDTTGLFMRLDYDLAPRLAFQFTGRGYRNRQSGGETSFSDRDFVRAEPRLAYRLGRNTELAVGYRLRYQDREALGDSATSNAVFLTLRYDGRRQPLEDLLSF